MKKHTKEYAEVLALADVNGEIRNHLDLCVKRGFARGYIAAIEENAVPELIEALIGLRNEIVEIDPVEMHGDMPLRRAYNKAQNVLNKINQ